LRNLVGDPAPVTAQRDLAITTLTLRRAASGDAWFLLHRRVPAKVTHAGGLYQVIPVGIFQPADDNPASEQNDLSLWRSMVREFSEELLATSEDYRHLGSPLDYGRWPFYRELSAARETGKLRVSCLGVGVDPLTLAVDVLTVAVFDSEFFDATFDGLVGANAEGHIIASQGAAGTPVCPSPARSFGLGVARSRCRPPGRRYSSLRGGIGPACWAELVTDTASAPWHRACVVITGRTLRDYTRREGIRLSPS
jgi:hypothetical protein